MKTLPEAMYKLVIEQDIYPENPRYEYDPIASIAIHCGYRYNFGDESLSSEEIEEIMADDKYVWLPVCFVLCVFFFFYFIICFFHFLFLAHLFIFF